MTPPTALPQAVDVLTGQPVPFPLRALSIDSAGRIVRRDHKDAVFGFAVGGTAFRACARESAGGIQVAIEAELATLPFSAESPAARRELRALAAETRLTNGRLLVVDHRIVALSTALDVPGPASPIDVIAHLVAMVLELRPYLTRIAALAVPSRPGRAVGTA